jgi:hypothetical protein
MFVVDKPLNIEIKADVALAQRLVHLRFSENPRVRKVPTRASTLAGSGAEGFTVYLTAYRGPGGTPSRYGVIDQY